MKTNPNELAFPGDSREARQFCGLSKREYFATIFAQGLAAHGDGKKLVKSAVKHADWLIGELNNRNKTN